MRARTPRRFPGGPLSDVDLRPLLAVMCAWEFAGLIFLASGAVRPHARSAAVAPRSAAKIRASTRRVA